MTSSIPRAVTPWKGQLRSVVAAHVMMSVHRGSTRRASIKSWQPYLPFPGFVVSR